jgi:hypothetical protein
VTSFRIESQIRFGRSIVRMHASSAAFGWAWLASVMLLALHVVDEAAHDFLSVYNPNARRIRRALGGIPFPPVFTFRAFLAVLFAAVALLAALTPFAFDGAAWIRPLAWIFGIVEAANGTAHLAESAIMRRRLPGFLSAPFVLLGAIWLLIETARLP